MPDPFLSMTAEEPSLCEVDRYFTNNVHTENECVRDGNWEPGDFLYYVGGNFERQMIQLINDYGAVPVLSHEFWCRKCDVAWTPADSNLWRSNKVPEPCWMCGKMTRHPFSDAEQTERYGDYD